MLSSKLLTITAEPNIRAPAHLILHIVQDVLRVTFNSNSLGHILPISQVESFYSTTAPIATSEAPMPQVLERCTRVFNGYLQIQADVVSRVLLLLLYFSRATSIVIVCLVSLVGQSTSVAFLLSKLLNNLLMIWRKRFRQCQHLRCDDMRTLKSMMNVFECQPCTRHGQRGSKLQHRARQGRAWIFRRFKYPQMLSSGPDVESRLVAQFYHRRIHLAILTCFISSSLRRMSRPAKLYQPSFLPSGFISQRSCFDNLSVL